MNQYFSCCCLKGFTTRLIPLYVRYEAVNFFIIHSFEEQFKNLEISCQNLHIPLILQYFPDKIA